MSARIISQKIKFSEDEEVKIKKKKKKNNDEIGNEEEQEVKYDIDLPVAEFHFDVETEDTSIAKTYETKNEMDLTLQIPKSDYKNESLKKLIESSNLPVQDEFYYRDIALNMVMAGDNQKTLLFSHGRITLKIKHNTKADYVTVEMVVKQKEDMYRGVVFGLDVDSTYKRAKKKILNPKTLNVVVPTVAVASAVVNTGIKNAVEVTGEDGQGKITGAGVYSSDESGKDFANVISGMWPSAYNNVYFNTDNYDGKTSIWELCIPCTRIDCPNRSKYIKDHFVYHSQNLPGLTGRILPDGSIVYIPSEDMNYGDKSLDDMRVILKNFVKSGFPDEIKAMQDGNSDYFFKEFQNLVAMLSAFGLQTEAMKVINYFKDAEGKANESVMKNNARGRIDYENSTITAAAGNHASSKEYVKAVLSALNIALSKTNGDLGKTTEDKVFNDTLIQQLVRPKFTSSLDLVKGLFVLVHDTQGNELNILDYMYCPKYNKYNGVLLLNIYDDFGVSWGDIFSVTAVKNGIKIGYLIGFRAWYYLQHYSGFHNNNNLFRPFITRMKCYYKFSGSIAVDAVTGAY